MAAVNQNWNPASWKWTRPETWNALYQGFAGGTGIAGGVAMAHNFARTANMIQKMSKVLHVSQKTAGRLFLTGSYGVGTGLAYAHGVLSNNGSGAFWEWDFTNPATWSSVIDGFDIGMGWPQASIEMLRGLGKISRNPKKLFGYLEKNTSKRQALKNIFKNPKHPLYKTFGGMVAVYFMGSSASGTLDITQWDFNSFSTYENILNGVFLGKDTSNLLKFTRETNNLKLSNRPSFKKKSHWFNGLKTQLGSVANFFTATMYQKIMQKFQSSSYFKTLKDGYLKKIVEITMKRCLLDPGCGSRARVGAKASDWLEKVESKTSWRQDFDFSEGMLQEYTKALWKTYSNEPKFFLAIQAQFSHAGIGNKLPGIDSDVVDFLRWFKTSSFSNDTVLMIFSDHGERDNNAPQNLFKEVTLNIQRPMFFIQFPEWVIERIPAEFETLVNNSVLLTSMADVYATIRHLVSNDTAHQLTEDGQSLLEPLSKTRTCETLRLSDHVCNCHHDFPFQSERCIISNHVVHNAAGAVLTYLHNLLHSALSSGLNLPGRIVEESDVLFLQNVIGGRYPGEHILSKDLCLTWHLVSVDAVIVDSKFITSTEVRMKLDLSLTVSPGPSHFRATVIYSQGKNETSGSDGEYYEVIAVSRLDLFAPTATCVRSTLRKIEPFCFCPERNVSWFMVPNE
ncbi:unnamed protein product [Notodromas monacha]|uniref:Uncharacterized protein n=1 Tax=Notodromas monacha TaxID=399045 RepID=A0A7R9C1M9_9CRUS|nr:unnamed protein product [Notodromas monacha]CAG0924460.1 unnamed protein product [Notodromas monacha]